MGPSSSHTMGPLKAAEYFVNKHLDSSKFSVTLYGSLAATGRGHMTDVAIQDVFNKHDKEIEIIWKPTDFLTYHPNAMLFSTNIDGSVIEETIYSVGGGALSFGDDIKPLSS